MAPHSSTLAWKIPWTEEPGRLQSVGSLRVRHDWATSFTFHFHALEKEKATHSSVLAWRIPGTGEPGGLPSMGSYRVGHNWSDSAAAAGDIIQSHGFKDLLSLLFNTSRRELLAFVLNMHSSSSRPHLSKWCYCTTSHLGCRSMRLPSVHPNLPPINCN